MSAGRDLISASHGYASTIISYAQRRRSDRGNEMNDPLKKSRKSFRGGRTIVPLIYRGMLMDGDRPALGGGANFLYVRCSLDDSGDIREEDGMVLPRTGGMSVAPTQESLPPHRQPRRLKQRYPDRFPDAKGSDKLYCWHMGAGIFATGSIAFRLSLRLDPELPDTHGFVEPDVKMSVSEYEGAITTTRSQWVRWSENDDE